MGWMRTGRRMLKRAGRMNPMKSGFKGKKHARKAVAGGEVPDYRQMAAAQSLQQAQ